MKIFLTGLIFSSIFYVTNAQNIPGVLNVKTPEVSAFDKFIETPVSYYSGLPNISIPIYEINIRGVNVPITLDYHAGGIRADEDASWVGLGWSLNYGGQISRKVRGAPDEKFYYGATGTASVDGFNQMSQSGQTNLASRAQVISNAKNDLADYMPDEFYYSALGYSGRFMYSQEQNKFMLFPKEDIVIKSFSGSGTAYWNTFYYWNLTLPNGTSMDFGKDGTIGQQDLDKTSDYIISSWQVKCIRNIYNDSVSYAYDDSSYQQYKLIGESYTIQPVPSNPWSYTITKFGYTDAKIKTINFPNGTVNFVQTSRTDMPANALGEIDVADNSGDLIRRIVFHYSYFYGNTYDILPTLNSTISGWVSDGYQNSRLRLDSMSISGTGTQSLTYKFDYYTSAQLPSKYTFAQDHWGFYNGIANTGLYSFIPNMLPNYFAGGDRRVDTTDNNVFSLKSIVYPEGGKVVYNYESNRAGLSNIPGTLLETYQDNNLRDTSMNIAFSGYARSSFYPAPDSTDGNGVRYFIKRFTVSPYGHTEVGFSWNVHTTYGISSLETNTPYSADNLDFRLAQLLPSGWEVIRDFNTSGQSQSAPYSRNGIDTNCVTMGPGTYEMIVAVSYSNPVGSPADNQPYNTGFSVTWREMNQNTQMIYTGGVRIKTINYYDADGSLKRSKSFTYYNPNNLFNLATYTSGRLISFPQYFQYQCQENTTCGNTSCTPFFQLKLFSNSMLPLETTCGSYSGYEYVNEMDVDSTNLANNLTTAYNFSFTQPYFSQYYAYMQLGGWEPEEWTRGKLLSKKYYKNGNVIKQENYAYYSWSPNLSNGTQEDYVQEINADFTSLQANSLDLSNGSNTAFDFYGNAPTGLQFVDVINSQGGTSNLPVFYYGASIRDPDAATIVPYFLHYTGFDKPQMKTTTTYDDYGNSISELDSFFYERTPNLYQLTRKKTTSSKGDILESLQKYPFDFSSNAPYNNMLQRGIVDPIVQRTEDKNGSFLQSVSTNFQNWGNGVIAPVNAVSQVLTHSPDTVFQYSGYDSKGNPLVMAKASDEQNSYLWDYSGQYPIAKTVNATQSDIAYTSFEADGRGNWTIPDTTRVRTTTALTGKLSYNLTGSNAITDVSLNSGNTYIVSYWGYAGNAITINGSSGIPKLTLGNWTYYETQISGVTSVTIGGTGGIDELRLYPKGALMTTYTYFPLVGMTSQCDPSGRLTYYTYDGLGRLKLIKDQYGNIIKRYDYQYQTSNQ
jgi:YD repeat-containing protein